MADQDDMYLENLDELVNDENKIITYKGLSSLLKVSANRAKQMLTTFVDQQASKGNQLNVAFLLGGNPSDSGKGYKFLMVMKEHLEAMKSKFCKVSCCHIYSVQKSKLKNFEILHDTDYVMIKSSLFDLKTWSSIYCAEAKLSDAALRRTQTLEEQPPLVNGFKGSSTVNSDVSSKQEVSAKSTASKSGTDVKQITSASFFGTTGTKQKKERQTAQDNGDNADAKNKSSLSDKKATATKKDEKTSMSFFGRSLEGKKQDASKQEAEKSESKAEEDDKDKKKNNAKYGEIKQSKMEVTDKVKQREDKVEIGEDEITQKSSKKTKRKNDQLEEQKMKRRKTELQNSESEEDDDFESFIKSSVGKESIIKTNTKKSVDADKGKKSKKDKSLEFEKLDDDRESFKTKKHSKETGEGRKTTKRKKKEISPEKTEGEQGICRDEVEVADVEDVEMAAVESGKSVVEESKPIEKRRIRKKVLKSKTFMNDEGYMVTEKVYESESASEESEPEEITKNSSKISDIAHMKPKDIARENKKIKAEASKNKTQSSLMSFFKKT